MRERRKGEGGKGDKRKGEIYKIRAEGGGRNIVFEKKKKKKVDEGELNSREKNGRLRKREKKKRKREIERQECVLFSHHAGIFCDLHMQSPTVSPGKDEELD